MGAGTIVMHGAIRNGHVVVGAMRWDEVLGKNALQNFAVDELIQI